MTRLLDISRLLRRAGTPLTGIDRVEFAYLRALSARPEPFFAIARTRLGYALLDKEGAAKFAQHISDNALGPLDLIGHLSPRADIAVRQAEATLRRLSIARAIPQRLGRMMRKHLPERLHYINAGHANFTPRMITALREQGAHIAVLIHDVIPLEAPHWQRPESASKFAGFIDRVSAAAHLIIYNSEDTRSRAQHHLPQTIPDVVAHLGVELAPGAPIAAHLRPKAPYFVVLGTIEPRKNHAFLLDLWQAWGPHAPQLILAGTRGWKNEEVFARLDNGIAQVREMPGLSDGEITTLLRGSHGLLFPSHLEGFGLPPLEAATLGCPVICQPLPVLRELLGDIPIYACGSDELVWRQHIEHLAEQRQTPTIFVPPSWAEHLNTVLRLI
ncbi:MAG: glycosyltransferase [Marinovum sp.]|nr:glycosyltransferase [Marinovum sp.]